MQALFNIVEDDHPPIPPNLSKEINHFLLCCFTKDPKKRIPAASLLTHPWMQSAPLPYTSYEEVHAVIKKHNMSRHTSLEVLWKPEDAKKFKKETLLLVEEKADTPDAESPPRSPAVPQHPLPVISPRPKPTIPIPRVPSRGHHKRSKSNNRKLDLPITVPNPTEKTIVSPKKKNRENLILEIIMVTHQRDLLVTENEELRQQLDLLEQECEELKQT